MGIPDVCGESRTHLFPSKLRGLSHARPKRMVKEMQELKSKASFGNPNRAWRQKEIPITSFNCFATFETMDRVAALCKEAGFTALEFQRRDEKEIACAVEACRKHGLQYMLDDFRWFGAFQDSRMAPWTQETRAKAADVYANDPAFFGYYVWDEPFPGQFPLARQVTDELERIDPAHFPYSVALPSYQDRYTWPNEKYESYLREYTEVIQPPVLSLDYYPFFFEARNPGELDRGNLYNDLGLLRKLSLETNTPFWFYFQCWRHRSNLESPPMTGEMVRFQFYNVLLHGGRGMQWFIIFDNIVTRDGRKGYQFELAKELNAECKALENVLLGLTSRAVYYGNAIPRPGQEDQNALLGLRPEDDLARPGQYDSSEPVNSRFGDDIRLDPIFSAVPCGITIGRFDDGYGHDYAMIQNRDFEAFADIALPLRAPKRLVEISRRDGRITVLAQSANHIRMELRPGDAVLLRLDDPDSPCEEIRYLY